MLPVKTFAALQAVLHSTSSLKLHRKNKNCSMVVNPYPRSQAPPSFPSLAVRKSGRGPGIFYHVSDVEGREKVERT